MLDTGAYVSALAADSEALADLAADHLDRPVPACPDWAVADLLGHLGGVYSWAWLAVRAAGEKPDGPREQPPSEREQLLGWFRDQRTAVMDILTSTEPDHPAWNFLPRSTSDVGWWRRRQALETAMHLCDVEAAVGRSRTIDPDLAAEGVDEYLSEFLPALLGHHPVADLQGSLHVHCTDAEGEWMLDFSGPEPLVTREHAKADTAVRGPAAVLFQWVWNRTPLDTAGVEVFGRREPAEALAGIRL